MMDDRVAPNHEPLTARQKVEFGLWFDDAASSYVDAIEAEAVTRERTRLRAAVEGLPLANIGQWANRKRGVRFLDRTAVLALLTPTDHLPPEVTKPFDEADDMCPNCVTPWKCNGPHLPPDGEKA